ncbi:hypothetical protein ACE939_01385 [Aquimarina sp. W85]|uniref:hypothetical protein n=1 Tax=Aquimarina rhodophyticola TaxID=3342246 RepID=UPI00366CFE4A
MKKGIHKTYDVFKVMAVVMTLSLIFIQPVLQLIFFIEETTPTVLVLGSEENNEQQHQVDATVTLNKLDYSSLNLLEYSDIETLTNFAIYTTIGFSEIIQEIPIPPPDSFSSFYM